VLRVELDRIDGKVALASLRLENVLVQGDDAMIELRLTGDQDIDQALHLTRRECRIFVGRLRTRPIALVSWVDGGWSMKSWRVLLFATCVAYSGCEPTPHGHPKAKPNDGERVEWIDPKTIQPGPIRRETLSDDQMARIRTLQSIFVEVDGQTVDQWVDDFKRDADPEKELQVWERMAKAYRAYCNGKQLSATIKKDVYRVVLLRSMASEQEVLERVKLTELSRDAAIAVMKDF